MVWKIIRKLRCMRSSPYKRYHHAAGRRGKDVMLRRQWRLIRNLSGGMRRNFSNLVAGSPLMYKLQVGSNPALLLTCLTVAISLQRKLLLTHDYFLGTFGNYSAPSRKLSYVFSTHIIILYNGHWWCYCKLPFKFFFLQWFLKYS